MSIKDSTENKKETILDPSIEELAQKLNIPKWVMAGAKHFYKWGAGKRMPEKEFIRKIEDWQKGPMYRGGK